MGGSGTGFFEGQTPAEIKEALRRAEEATRDQTFDARVSEAIGDLLSDYNSRDTAAVGEAVGDIKRALELEVEDGAIEPLFGGSVRKHTYVDGISDVDCLFVLKGDELGAQSPARVLEYFNEQLRERFPDAELRADRMSITVELRGVEIQALPAIRRAGGLCIPDASGREWARIHPEGFFRKLSDVNSANAGKVVPTIKIVKGINDGFAEPQRLTGYHIESLAIEAFRGYNGPRNTKAMVEHFFSTATELVLTPIRDRTGQSVHVDDYAGPRSSDARNAMSQNFGRIFRRIRNANAQGSVEKWIRILDPGSE